MPFSAGVHQAWPKPFPSDLGQDADLGATNPLALFPRIPGNSGWSALLTERMSLDCVTMKPDGGAVALDIPKSW